MSWSEESKLERGEQAGSELEQAGVRGVSWSKLERGEQAGVSWELAGVRGVSWSELE